MINKFDGNYEGFCLTVEDKIGSNPVKISINRIKYNVYTEEVYTSHKFDLTYYTNVITREKLHNYNIFETYEEAEEERNNRLTYTKNLLSDFINIINSQILR